VASHSTQGTCASPFELGPPWVVLDRRASHTVDLTCTSVRHGPLGPRCPWCPRCPVCPWCLRGAAMQCFTPKLIATLQTRIRATSRSPAVADTCGANQPRSRARGRVTRRQALGCPRWWRRPRCGCAAPSPHLRRPCRLRVVGRLHARAQLASAQICHNHTQRERRASGM
jgi:hypothetical protein